MKTTADNITLSPGLTTLSPENLSTLIDTWPELQISAVEAVQTPTSDLFVFAESCLVFAAILQNEPPPDSDGGSKVNELLEDVEPESPIKGEACTLSLAGSSSITLVPDYCATENLRDEFTSVGAGRAQHPDLAERTAHKLESYDWSNASPNSRTRIYDADASDRAFQLAGLNVWGPGDSSKFARERNITNKPACSSNDSSHNPRYSTLCGDIDSAHKHKKAIGIVYLTSSPHENVPAGQVNIGIILTPEARRKGFAREAIDLMLAWVFEDMGFHRVQACILDSHNTERAISMFTQLGFVHEGIRRRSVYCPNEGVRGAWKDVTYLALLETEWFIRSSLTLAPRNIWDEMFARHAMEREELLRWHDRQQRLQRIPSTKTVRVLDTPYKTASAVDNNTADPLKQSSSTEAAQIPDMSFKPASTTDEKSGDPFASEPFQSSTDISSAHKEIMPCTNPVGRQSQASSPRKFSCVIM